jgi:hypothetical protein
LTTYVKRPSKQSLPLNFGVTVIAVEGELASLVSLPIAELSRIGSRHRRYAPPLPPHSRRACGPAGPTRRGAPDDPSSG